MIAYKGFNEELHSVLGNGKKETCTFTPGITLTEESSKTARSGFHCCENPFDCLTYYSFNGKNRFFMVEAAGDIDEDESGRIACTKITLLKELTPLEFAMAGMKYMIEHPGREPWVKSHYQVQVGVNMAEAEGPGHIAIARGETPKVKGPAGSILGIIREEIDFGIVDAKMFVPDESEAGKWLEIGHGRKVVEVCYEESIS